MCGVVGVGVCVCVCVCGGGGGGGEWGGGEAGKAAQTFESTRFSDVIASFERPQLLGPYFLLFSQRYILVYKIKIPMFLL